MLLNNENISSLVPKETFDILNQSPLFFIDDYYSILKYKILTNNNLEKYQTVDEGLDSALKKHITSSSTYQELIEYFNSIFL